MGVKKKTTKQAPKRPPRASADSATTTMPPAPSPQEDVLRALVEFLRAGAKLLTAANEQMQREED